jgi:hypothetical protein
MYGEGLEERGRKSTGRSQPMVDLGGCGETAAGLFCLLSNIIIVSVTAFGNGFPRKVVGVLSPIVVLILVWLVVALVGICDVLRMRLRFSESCEQRSRIYDQAVVFSND